YFQPTILALVFASLAAIAVSVAATAAAASDDVLVSDAVAFPRSDGSGDSLSWEAAESGGHQKVPLGGQLSIRLYGRGLQALDRLAFANTHHDNGLCLDAKLPTSFRLKPGETGLTAVAMVTVPSDLVPMPSGGYLLLCLHGNWTTKVAKKSDSTEEHRWRYPGGSDGGPRFYVTKETLPLWAKICFTVALMLLSGLFSGLNLGLMALDIGELKIICRAGSPSERAHAKRIIPVRKRGNFLLCSLLLGNVVVNTTLSIILSSLIGDGITTVIAASLGIVLFGEIIPQAVCTRHGLAIGAFTLPITILFMALTAPISFPLSVLLDKILGQDLRQVYDRNKLKEFIANQNLERTEANIILGALSLQNKTIGQVMRGLSEVYMLPAETLIDSFTVEQIRETGFTRIPIYDRERSNIISVLNFKDLTIVSRDAPMRVDLVCEYFNRKVHSVMDTDTLDSALKLFLSNRVHMAIVRHRETDAIGVEVNEESTVGMVTLEDILEEIIQEEIEDETDVSSQPSHRPPPRVPRVSWRELALAGSTGMQVPAQLRMAAVHCLAIQHSDLFGKRVIPEIVLERMFQEKVLIKHMFIHGDDDRNTIYRRGVPADYAVFILEGRIRLSIGVEDLNFEATVFTLLGAKTLLPVRDLHHHRPSALAEQPGELHKLPAFLPDYWARAQQNLQYLRLSRAQYAALLRIADAVKPLDGTSAGGAAELDELLSNLFGSLFPRMGSEPRKA
uniref:CNNM transmembrane domain-containing protein n=2 Tax=Macrostomum lignano TaxID=282301 RepID=A0A1I8GE10_9PLAT